MGKYGQKWTSVLKPPRSLPEAKPSDVGTTRVMILGERLLQAAEVKGFEFY
jgi:hypothetical protein